jgi:hypothetical protein
MFVSTTVVSTRSRPPRTTRRWRARPTRRATNPWGTSGPRQWLSRISVLASGTRSEDHLRRRPETTPAAALAVAPAQSLDHLVHQLVIREHRVDRPERGIPELVAVGQQHLDQATLEERASDHLPSAKAVGPRAERAAPPRAAGDSARPAPAAAPGAPARPPDRTGPAGPGPAARSTRRWSRPTPGSSCRDGGRASGPPGNGTPAGLRCGRSRRGCQRRPGGPGAGMPHFCTGK